MVVGLSIRQRRRSARSMDRHSSTFDVGISRNLVGFSNQPPSDLAIGDPQSSQCRRRNPTRYQHPPSARIGEVKRSAIPAFDAAWRPDDGELVDIAGIQDHGAMGQRSLISKSYE